MDNEKKFTAQLDGRDHIELVLDETQHLKSLKAVGCSETIQLVHAYRNTCQGRVEQWPSVQGRSHSELLLKEVLLKAQGAWQLPYEHAEICHCRNVATHIVDQAIVAGAHSSQLVSRQTSASTACGTCKEQVEKIIAYRLKS